MGKLPVTITVKFLYYLLLISGTDKHDTKTSPWRCFLCSVTNSLKSSDLWTFVPNFSHARLFKPLYYFYTLRKIFYIMDPDWGSSMVFDLLGKMERIRSCKLLEYTWGSDSYNWLKANFLVEVSNFKKTWPCPYILYLKLSRTKMTPRLPNILLAHEEQGIAQLLTEDPR